MFKTLMMSASISALMISGALAQANPPANPPPARAEMAPADGAKFISAQSADQFVFSKFKGTNVLGPDDAKVGDVTDLLLDKSGKVLGVIVGVGGFLGIGEKNVAIDMSAFQIAPAADDPNNIKLKVSWTKDQLKNAPDFQYYRPAARTTERPMTSPTTGMAPRPAPADGSK
jgi:hypothetical protein